MRDIPAYMSGSDRQGPRGHTRRTLPLSQRSRTASTPLHLLLSLLVAGSLALAPGVVLAAASASHTVTVQVNAINELATSGGNITLTISTADPGVEPTAAIDVTTCGLVWTTNETSKKITVETDLGAPQFTLVAAAQAVVGGTAAPLVYLSTTAQDYVIGVSETVGSCNLGYGAIATTAQGTGTDVHTIIYTLIDS